MRILHQKLHLQHHHHTGKMLHHRHTSYRGLAVILLLAGIFMSGLAIMQRVTAESMVSIYVTVHVPRPRTPAIIALPEDGANIPGGDTLIGGSCPILAPQAVVIVNVDGADVGSAICDTNNDFGLSVSLAAGAHTIIAKATSIDSDQGPSSAPVHITARPVATKGPTPTATPVAITSDNLFTTVNSDRNAEWSGTLKGGAGSYKLLLDWGDGTYNNYTVKPGPLHVSHHYTNLAAYNVNVGLSDSSDNYQHLQYAVALSSDTLPGAVASTDSSLPASAKTATVIGLYGFFVTAVCVVAIIRLHAMPFAYTDITLGHHHAKN